MLNRKLLEILARLTQNQRKRFRLFLISPFFNNSGRSAVIVALYDYIISLDADENHPELQKEVVSALFFPDLPFVENQKNHIDSITSDLIHLTRQFLTQVRREKTKGDEGLAMLEFYRKAGLEDRFKQTAENFLKELDKSPERDAEYYRIKSLVDLEITTVASISNTFEDDSNLTAYNHNLDMAFALNKLQVLAALKMQKLAANIAVLPDEKLFGVVTELTQNHGILSTPLTQIFHLVVQLIDDPQHEANLTQFITLVQQHRALIPDDIFKDQLMAYYRIFVSLKSLRSADKSEKYKTYLLYKEHYNAGYFEYEHGMILPTNFTALIQWGLKNNDFEWVLQLLNNHPPEKVIGTRFAHEACNLHWADYYFSQRNYDAAIEKIEIRLFENPIYSILADIILIKIYYEQKSDPLEHRMKALDQKIRRSGMSEHMKERYHNFLRKLDKINKHLQVANKTKRGKLVEEIRSVQNIYERDWLLAKVTEA